MYSATGRIKTVKQPKGGYLKTIRFYSNKIKR